MIHRVVGFASRTNPVLRTLTLLVVQRKMPSASLISLSSLSTSGRGTYEAVFETKKSIILVVGYAEWFVHTIGPKKVQNECWCEVQ